MRTILLTIEYEGTNYSGWQWQLNSVSVQAVVEAALAKQLNEPVRLHSSGRTDAGVHARGMMAHFRTERDLPLRAFREGLNRLLPADVAIRAVREVSQDFHARFSARGKWYRYSISRGEARSPLNARTSWHLHGALDLDAMRRAAALLVGEHDFQAFRASSCTARTSIRKIYAVELSEQDDRILIDVRGSGFLKYMVRIMVGTLVEIGRGRRPPEDIDALLTGSPGLSPGPTAPSQGLCLMEVWYST